MKLSPHRLTHASLVLAFAVWLGLVTSTWPRAHPVLYLQDSLRAWLHLNAFRGEPAISAFDWHFTPTHTSSKPSSTDTGSGVHAGITCASPWTWVDHAVSGLLLTIKPSRLKEGHALFELAFALPPPLR